MKALQALAFTFLLPLPAFASDTVTLTGTAMCGKCEMKEAPKCQNVLKVADGETTTIYYMTENLEHGKLFCKGTKAGVTVTGTVEEVDGKQMLTPTSVKAPE